MKLLPAAYKLPKPTRPIRCKPSRCSPDDPVCPGGAGFLYPDPPDWWAKEYAVVAALGGEPKATEVAREEWELFCDTAWRVLKVVGTE